MPLKLILNTFRDNKILTDSDGNTIEWDYLKKLIVYQYHYGLHVRTKIRKRHINFQTEKMRVRLATQLLSCSVSNALHFMRTVVKLPEFSKSLGTEKFCMMNNIFDLLNSRNKYVKVPSKCLINQSNITEIRSKVMEYENYIRSLQCEKIPILNSKRKLGFYGLIVSMRNCIAIFDKCASTNESPLEYLLTYKLSQNYLELFFSSIRSRGGYNNNPTTEQFQFAFK